MDGFLGCPGCRSFLHAIAGNGPRCLPVRHLRLAAFSMMLVDRVTPLIRAANLHSHPYPSTGRTTAIPRFSLKQSSQPPSVRQLIPNKEWAFSSCCCRRRAEGHNIAGVLPPVTWGRERERWCRTTDGTCSRMQPPKWALHSASRFTMPMFGRVPHMPEPF